MLDLFLDIVAYAIIIFFGLGILSWVFVFFSYFMSELGFHWFDRFAAILGGNNDDYYGGGFFGGDGGGSDGGCDGGGGCG